MKKVAGVGINDADYKVFWREEGKAHTCLAYGRWRDMLRRCYSKGLLRRRPDYKGNSTDEKWHLFSNFKRWYDNNYVEGWEIDKDLLTVGNKVYSEDTCVFIPKSLNGGLSASRRVEHDLPVGVIYRKKEDKVGNHLRVKVNQGTPYYKERTFKCPLEANEFFRTERARYLETFLGLYGDKIDSGIEAHLEELRNPSENSIYVVRK